MNFHLEFYKQEEEKRKEREEKNQIHLLNIEIRNLIQSIDSDVLEDEETLDKECELNNYLIQTSVRKVGWQNNLEELNTVYVQIEWIAYLIVQNKFIPNSLSTERAKEIKQELDRYMHIASFHYTTRSGLRENNGDFYTNLLFK